MPRLKNSLRPRRILHWELYPYRRSPSYRFQSQMGRTHMRLELIRDFVCYGKYTWPAGSKSNSWLHSIMLQEHWQLGHGTCSHWTRINIDLGMTLCVNRGFSLRYIYHSRAKTTSKVCVGLADLFWWQFLIGWDSTPKESILSAKAFCVR